MKRRLATIYAVFCTLLLVAGFLLVFYFSWQAGMVQIVKCIIGFAMGFILSPIIHELGHVSFALIAKMDYVYVKCFCFKIYIKNGKKRLGFASPFAADETQVMPKVGGNMKKRAGMYALGGLIYSGIFLTLILGGIALTVCFNVTSYKLWGMLPYMAYLFLLNVLPFEYASGKTDALVYKGIRKDYDAEKCMLAAMEIQGRLFEGKSFAEIEEEYYFAQPQLCEDEPLYAVMLDLQYRYFLEKEELEKAAGRLNRLAQNEEYLPLSKIDEVAAELVYMHSLTGNLELAESNYSVCREFLQGESVVAKRILAAYAFACGKMDACAVLIKQGYEALEKERIAGVRKFEEVLLSRIKVE